MNDRLPRGTVAVIGPGRVGTLLAAALTRAGHRIVAAGGGGLESRERFASRFAGTRTGSDVADLVRGVDLVLITTPDDVVATVADGLAAVDAVHEGQRMVHAAGSLGLDVLERPALAGARTAACHPAQTVPDAGADPDALVGAAWAVTARPADRAWAHDLVEQVGGTPHDLPDAARLLYHAGLTVGSNAVGAVVTVARRLLLAAGIDDPAAFLGPLVTASTRHTVERGAAALTGPVTRGDAGTITRHLEVLDADLPEFATAYRALSRVILDQVRPSLAEDQVTALEAALGDGG